MARDPRPLGERRKMWARRAAERTPARVYVDRLLAIAAPCEPADLEKLIREDASITPLRKLVALEVLDLEIRKRARDEERKAASTQPTTAPAARKKTRLPPRSGRPDGALFGANDAKSAPLGRPLRGEIIALIVRAVSRFLDLSRGRSDC